MNSYLRLRQGGLGYLPPYPLDVAAGRRVHQVVEGEDLVYGFYVKPTDSVKLGRTRDVRARWSKIEQSTGMPAQLFAVWLTADSRGLERVLHSRFQEARGLGEWFKAEGVLPSLFDEFRSVCSPGSMTETGAARGR
jgi:hypothetical protein